jgi:hypothetical protein
MEIKEIISYYLNGDTNIIEVSFRTIEDEEDVLRNDTIDYTIVEEYGFDLVTESFDFFGDDDDFEGDIFEQETIELQFDAFGHLIDTEDTHIRFDANGKIQYDFMEWVLQFLVSQRELKLSTHSNGRRNTD